MPMSVQCSQCKKRFFTPKSDVILGFSRCKKGGTIKQVVGELTLLNWVIRDGSGNLNNSYK